MIASLVVPQNVESLVDFWKANGNMLDWAKKQQPDIYEEIRLAFAIKKKQLQGEENA